MKVAVHGYRAGIRPGCAFVLEWNLPFRNPGSATGMASDRASYNFTKNFCLSSQLNLIIIDLRK